MNATITGGTTPYGYSWTGPGGFTATAQDISSVIAGAYTLTVSDANGCTATQSFNVNQPGLFTANGVVSTFTGGWNVACAGGSNGAIDMTVSGGTSPYTHAWTGPSGFTSAALDIIGLQAGTYNYVLTDVNGCSASATFTLTAPPPVTFVVASTQPITCNGDDNAALSISGSGGTAPLNYTWTGPGGFASGNPSITGLAPGTYTLVVSDANGCSDGGANTWEFLDPAVLLPGAGMTTDVSCFGGSNGSAVANVVGGVPAYSITWNTTPAQSGANASGLAAGTYTATVTDARGCIRTQNVNIAEPASALNAGISAHTDVNCFGNSTGSATASVSGGTSPYSYSWNTTPVQNSATASNLPAGSYTCTITDANGCGTSITATITQPGLALSAVIGSSADVLCFGNNTGSAIAAAAGGTAPYSYAWNSTPVQNTAAASNLSAGAYTCTITDIKGCVTIANATISQPSAPLNATIASQTNVDCRGNNTGSASLSVSGGTPAYSYAWNTSPVQTTAAAAGLTSGSYTCTITDAHGCTSTQDVTVTQPAAALTASISAQTNVLIFGQSTGSATVTASGGTAPYAQSWSNGQTTATATGLAAGSYTVTVTDANGCSTSTGVNITQPGSALSAVISAQTNVLCFGNSTGSATVTANGGAAPYSYSWNTSPVQTTATATDLPAGTYTCIVTDANGATATATAILAQPTGALSASISAQTNVDCFGNSTGSVAAEATGGTPGYSYSWNTTPAQNTAMANGLVAGSYVCTITDLNGCSTTVGATIAQPTAALSASIMAQTNVLIFGQSTGSATVAAVNGTAPYAYLWDDGQTTATAINLAAGSYGVIVTDANGCTAAVSVTITQPGSALSAVLTSQVNVDCFGNSTGSATVSANGGTAPYSFVWNTSPAQNVATASVLPAGSYTCTVTDINGATTAVSVTIAGPAAALSAIIASYTDVDCFGNSTGSATVNASGGTPNYTMVWSTSPEQIGASATNLVAGTYTCSITDANGCTTTQTAAIAEPAATLSATISAQTNIDCSGNSTGSATATTTGGTAPYDYSWDTAIPQTTATATGLSAGTWTCTITDANGCTTVVSATITQPAAALSASIAGTTQATCGVNNGGTTAIVSGGTSPYSYSWDSTPVQNSANLTGVGAGTYTCTITDANGCGTNAIANVSSPNGLAITLLGTSAQTCFGTANGQATVAVSGGNSPYSIIWNTVPVQNGATASGLLAGNHLATVQDADGCTASVNAVIDGPTAPLALSVSSTTDVLCYGGNTGAATVSASGGLPPYAIAWNTTPAQSGATATDLMAGTYAATVTDAFGCSTSINAPIQQPLAPIDGYVDDLQNVNCAGGSDGFATIEAMGGSGSWTMEWSTTPPQSGATATGLSAGLYFVTITDNNGCATPKLLPVTITEPTAPLLITSSTSTYSGFGTSCTSSMDGSINISISGGTPGYSFAWSGPGGFISSAEDISNLGAGIYNLVATDANGCVQTLSVTLTAPAAINATGGITTAACNGTSTGAVDMTPMGGVAPYSQAWTGPAGFNAATEDISTIPAGVYSVTITDANGCLAPFFFNVSEPGLIDVDATISGYAGGYNVSCSASNDGSIDATVTGGTMPYTYAWSGPSGYTAAIDDISGLAAGVYDLTITDANGCGTLAEYTLTAPAVLFGTLVPATYPSGGNVSCDGEEDGVIDATINGGTPVYAITWSGPNGFASNVEDISGLAPGNYTMSAVDMNGCSATQNVTILSPNEIDASLSVSQYNSGDAVSCNGGSNGIIDLSISGGIAPYSVNWTGPNGYTSTDIDITGLEAGTYTALVHDAAGCDTTLSITLTEPPPVQASGITSDHNGFEVGCNGSSDGSIDVSATGGAGNFIYQWLGPNAFASNAEDISGLQPGVYDVIVNDMNGCKTLLTFTLDAPPAIGTAAVIASAACQGADDGAIDLTITGGVMPYDVQWTGPGGFNASSEDLTQLFAGIYIATITDANGCTFSQPYNVSEPGLFTITASTAVYPGGYGVSCAGASDGSIDVTASGGTAPLFFSWQGPGGFASISEDISGLAAGTYDLTLTDANGCNHLASWTITSPTVINIGLAPSQFADGSNVACSGGSNASIDATIIGGVTPYSITWSGPGGFADISEDITGLVAGTYTLNVTDAIGCTSSSTITLTEPAPISLSVTSSQYISGGNISCNGSADGSIDLTISGGSLLYFAHWTGPNSFVSNNADISGLVAGNYSVTITDANGCTANASVNLIEPNPILIDLTTTQFGGGYSIGCNGTTGNVDAYVQGGAVPWTYLWTGPNGFTSNAQDLFGVTAGTYDLLVTDAAGCTAMATTTLTEPTAIDMTSTLSSAGNGFEVGCAGDDGSISLDISGGIAPYTFDWSGTNGFAALTEDLSGLAAGTYNVSITDVNGCLLQQSFTLEQAATLTLTTAITGNLCDGLDDGAIDLTVGGGVAPFSINWTGPNGFVSTNEDLSALVAGQYVANVTDANNCSAQLAANIVASVPMALDLYMSDYGDVSIPCVGSNTGVLEATITGGAGTLDILWTGPDGFSSTAPHLNGLFAGDYHLQITDDNGCSLDTTVTLTEPADPIDASFSAVVQASGTNISCTGGADGTVDLTVSGGTAPYDMTWHGPSGTSFSTEDISGAIAGHYDLVITDANGCSLTDSLTLTEPDSALMATIGVSQYNGGFNVSCDGQSDGSIGANVNGGSGALQISWSGPGGFTSSADSIAGLLEGTYTLNVTDENGCSLAEDVVIIAPEPITWELIASTVPGGTNISCHGMNNGAISTSVSGGSGTYEATWTGPNGSNSSSLEVTDLFAGEYCITITDGNGCSVSDCITLTEPEALHVTTVASPAGCGQSNGSVDAIISGGIAPYTHAWSNGAISEDISGVPANSYWTIVTDANGCTDSTMAQVTGGTAITGEGLVGDALCHGDPSGSISLTMTSGSAPYSFAWTGGSTDEDLTGLQAGSYMVQVTDAGGCSWSHLFTVHEPDAVDAESSVVTHDNGFHVSAPGAHDGTIAVEAIGGTAPHTYVWSNGATSGTVEGLSVGTYTVTITDANGCTRMLEFTLTGPDGVELPTGYTPNGDGHNDLFVIHGLENHPENQLLVFNRWGNVVYDRLNYKNDWGGENREGEYLPNGTYFVILRLGSDAMNLQGYVDLRR